MKISAKSGEVESKFEVSLGDRVQLLQDAVSVHVIKGRFIFSSAKALCKVPMEGTYSMSCCCFCHPVFFFKILFLFFKILLFFHDPVFLESSPEQIQCMQQGDDDQILPLQDSFLRVDISKGELV